MQKRTRTYVCGCGKRVMSYKNVCVRVMKREKLIKIILTIDRERATLLQIVQYFNQHNISNCCFICSTVLFFAQTTISICTFFIALIHFIFHAWFIILLYFLIVCSNRIFSSLNSDMYYLNSLSPATALISCKKKNKTKTLILMQIEELKL